jgi:hypothetical protein
MSKKKEPTIDPFVQHPRTLGELAGIKGVVGAGTFESLSSYARPEFPKKVDRGEYSKPEFR